MEFGLVQKKKFEAISGAYSKVTEREHSDQQITLTDFEYDLVTQYFGKENINVGNVKSDTDRSSKIFKLHPIGSEISLNLVFPKPYKTELRLYISKKAGFLPESNYIWFLYIKDGDLWIGALSEQLWRLNSSEYRFDESDGEYQNSLYEIYEGHSERLYHREDRYRRNRAIALQRLQLSEYKCDYDPAHRTFISRFNQRPYLEAHHLIPIGMQNEFGHSLDNINNLFSLCPFCHRAVHYAEQPLARNIISKLAVANPVLHDFGLQLSDLYRFYAVENIE